MSKNSVEWGKLFAGILLVVLVIALGVHYSGQLHGHILDVEHWIAGLGVWGPVAYLGLLIVLTSVFFPDSVLGAVAGALFGPWLGTAVVLLGAVIVQCIAFGLSHHFFKHRVQQAIERRPKLSTIQRAANHRGFRLQFLLRLLPLNPVMVSYVIGTTTTRFPVFLAALFGLIPGLFVQVYTGYAAKHMIKAAGQPGGHSTMHLVLVAAGLVVCLVLLVVVVRMAQKAVAEAE
jgi:uncharacterized membrane protein YdjX (TVP38/TMEM64 family)